MVVQTYCYCDTAQKIKRKKKDQQGFTALELLVVLIIGLIIIAWGASRIDRLFGKSKLSEGLSGVNLLLVNTKDLKTNSDLARRVRIWRCC